MCDLFDSLGYPFDPAFRLLGRRWGPEILFEIIGGTARYSQLQRALPGISPRTLSVRISELEQAGVIARSRKNGTECVYSLTEKGMDVRKVLSSIADLTIRWHKQV
jgi:DNA-binding HxlR family transcriptional regulator